MVLIIGQNSVWQYTFNLPVYRAGQVNRTTGVRQSPAGKGSNAARVLATLNIETTLLAYTGGANGEKFTEACSRNGFNCIFTKIQNETRICTTVIEDDGTVTELVEPAPAVTPEERGGFAAAFDDHIGKAKLLLVMGTAVQGEPDDCYKEFILKAKKHGVPVILDSYRIHGQRALEAAPEILKINREEFEALSGCSFADLADRTAGYDELLSKYGLKWLIITGGGEGAEGYGGGKIVEIQNPKVTVVNTIGSGDSFSAGLAYGLHACLEEEGGFSWSDEELETSIVDGVAAGTANCMSSLPGYLDPSDFHDLRNRLHRPV
jgi:tagatose 6-phosphate kinase